VNEDNYVIRRLDTDDIRQVQSHGQPWNHTYRQASRGSFRAQAVQVRSRTMELTHDHLHTGVIINGDSSHDVTAFACFAGRSHRHAHGAIARGDLLVFGGESELHFASDGPDEWVVVAIDTQTLHRWCERTGNEHLAGARSRIQARSMHAYSELFQSLQHVLRAAVTRQTAFEERVLRLLAEATWRGDSLTSARMLAVRAQQVLDRSFRSDVTLTQVCELVGAAPRTIQCAFQQTYGMSMRRYREILRLNFARSLLLHPQGRDPVRRAALSSGFSHLSRFAHSYSDFYGELPSATISQLRSTSDEDVRLV
jgi:AraC-like DNA-binding protein